MAFRLDAFLVSLLIFSFIIAVGSGWIVSMADHYDVEYDEQFSTSYTSVNEVYNLSVDQKEDVIGESITEATPLDDAVRGGTSALKLLTSPIRIIDLVVEDIEATTPGGIPDEINLSKYVTTGLTIMITFGLIYLFFRIRSW